MSLPPVLTTLPQRVALTASCRDCDDLPKVADGGKVFSDAQGQSYQIMHNGLRVQEGGYYGDWMRDLIQQCRGHHEPQEERLFFEVLRHLAPDARMIELGGFWAYYSLWFLQNRPERQSLVLEPEPSHLEVGKANAILNRLQPVFVHGFAGASAAPPAPFTCETGLSLDLPRQSVASLMEMQSWDRLDLLHCDIQGAEVDVLEGCRPLFEAGRVDWVFVSTHSHHISGDPLTHFRCLEILRQSGAIIEVEHDVHESFSGDGLIVARFCAAPEGWVPPKISVNRQSESLFRHLAFDLSEACTQRANLETELNQLRETSSMSPSLSRVGELLQLSEDGPLGRAGDTLIIPDDKVMAPAVKANAAWEYDILLEVAERVPKGAPLTLLDIGANVGLFSRQLIQAVPEIDRVICVEPDTQNFKALNYNLSHLGDRVQFCNYALGDSDGTLEFFRDNENFGNYSLNPDAVRNREHETVSVEVRGTADWMARHLDDSTRFIWKSDTQGFDEVIIASTPMDIWRRVEVASIEIWRIAKPSFDRNALLERLSVFPHRKLGTRYGVSAEEILEYLENDDWTFSDLIVWR